MRNRLRVCVWRTCCRRQVAGGRHPAAGGRLQRDAVGCRLQASRCRRSGGCECGWVRRCFCAVPALALVAGLASHRACVRCFCARAHVRGRPEQGLDNVLVRQLAPGVSFEQRLVLGGSVGVGVVPVVVFVFRTQEGASCAVCASCVACPSHAVHVACTSHVICPSRAVSRLRIGPLTWGNGLDRLVHYANVRFGGRHARFLSP